MWTFYRVIASGQWCGPSYENGGAEADAIAETLGLVPGSIAAVESETDIRPGTEVDWLNDPNVTVPEDAPAPEPSLAQRVDELTAILAKVAPEAVAASAVLSVSIVDKG